MTDQPLPDLYRNGDRLVSNLARALPSGAGVEQLAALARYVHELENAPLRARISNLRVALEQINDGTMSHASQRARMALRRDDRAAAEPDDLPLAEGSRYLDIVFSYFPGPGDECVFVELEDDSGCSLRGGEWIRRADGYVALRFTPEAFDAARRAGRV